MIADASAINSQPARLLATSSTRAPVMMRVAGSDSSQLRPSNVDAVVVGWAKASHHHWRWRTANGVAIRRHPLASAWSPSRLISATIPRPRQEEQGVADPNEVARQASEWL